jgi:hypothetical protein
VNISYPDTSTHNFSMTPGGSYFFEQTYTPVGSYSFFIWANDTSGNRQVSTGHSFVINPAADTTPPVISDVVAAPDPQITGGAVNITCDVTDNVAVDEVWVNISYPDTSTHNFSMTPGGSYFFEQTYTPTGSYSFFIWANDTSGNVIMSSVDTFVINPI